MSFSLWIYIFTLHFSFDLIVRAIQVKGLINSTKVLRRKLRKEKKIKKQVSLYRRKSRHYLISISSPWLYTISDKKIIKAESITLKQVIAHYDSHATNVIVSNLIFITYPVHRYWHFHCRSVSVISYIDT